MQRGVRGGEGLPPTSCDTTQPAAVGVGGCGGRYGGVEVGVGGGLEGVRRERWGKERGAGRVGGLMAYLGGSLAKWRKETVRFELHLIEVDHRTKQPAKGALAHLAAITSKRRQRQISDFIFQHYNVYCNGTRNTLIKQNKNTRGTGEGEGARDGGGWGEVKADRLSRHSSSLYHIVPSVASEKAPPSPRP